MKPIRSTENAAGCWIFIGNLRYGYGKVTRNKRSIAAHRAAWADAFGPIPDGLCVLHRCDVPACVNPNHLFVGTVADNNADRCAKGRGADRRGEKNPRAKLTWSKVAEIRADTRRPCDLAREYGVSSPTITCIKNGKIWSKPL